MVTSVMRNPNNIGDTFDKEYFFSEIGLKLNDKEGSKNHKKSRNTNYSANKSINKLKFLLRSANDCTDRKFRLLKSLSSSSVSEDSNQVSFQLVSSGYLISKWKNQPSEDAFFIHEKAVGVADGVGGWSRFGIDWSKFSNELMKRCRKYWERLERFEKFTSDIFLSNKFIENWERIFDSITEENKRIRLHSNSFWFNQQGQAVELSNSNDHKDFLNKSIEFFSRKSHKNLKDKEMMNLDPKSIIKYSWSSIKNYGSSTVWVSTLQNDTIKVANLGDSGFMLIRYNKVAEQSKIIAYSQEKQHAFNTPYQVTKIPKDTSILGKEYQRLSAHNANLFWNDDPSLADIYSTNVVPGDILILATDGLYDNLFFDDILDIINTFMKRKQSTTKVWKTSKFSKDWQESKSNKDSIYSQVNAYELASILANEAKKRSKSESTFSPFEKKWSSFILNYYKEKKVPEIEQSQPQGWKGGKKDDIWVVVSFISVC